MALNPSSTRRAFPRVQLPGVDRDQADALTDELTWRREMRMRFITAFARLGKPVAVPCGGDERKRRRAAGKRQRAGRRAAR